MPEPVFTNDQQRGFAVLSIINRIAAGNIGPAAILFMSPKETGI